MREAIPGSARKIVVVLAGTLANIPCDICSYKRRTKKSQEATNIFLKREEQTKGFCILKHYSFRGTMMERVQSDSETSTSERSVSFSTIEFHEHAMILGCSPSTTHGPPLEIDWMVMNSATIALDDYECLRPPRRPKEQLIMPEFVRQQV